nr:MAG TPA: hypothetical protein [Caudoviricetes sp.]
MGILKEVPPDWRQKYFFNFSPANILPFNFFDVLDTVIKKSVTGWKLLHSVRWNNPPKAANLN